MAGQQELKERIKDFYKFSKQEIFGLLVAVLVTAFIFSFRDWGEDFFDFIVGITNLTVMVIIVALSFLFRISCQKIYALGQGYKVEFKIWYLGLFIALIVAFISAGRVPLVLIGSAIAALMVKQRLGEFRYGFSYIDNANIAFWGVLGNLIAASIFAIGLYVFPQNYFFSKGLLLNTIMALCSLLPLPQLDGLNIFFGSRNLYYWSLFIVLITSVLLLTKTKIGLIAVIVGGASIGIFYNLTRSEK